MQEGILNGTNLREANLDRADLRAAKLSGANLSEALLTNADLRRAKDLACEQLTTAREWASAYRDEQLACGAEIPEPPESLSSKIKRRLTQSIDAGK